MKRIAVGIAAVLIVGGAFVIHSCQNLRAPTVGKTSSNRKAVPQGLGTTDYYLTTKKGKFEITLSNDYGLPTQADALTKKIVRAVYYTQEYNARAEDRLKAYGITVLGRYYTPFPLADCWLEFSLENVIRIEKK